MLRSATEADISQLAAIEAATQKAPWSEGTFTQCFQSNARGWVIEQTDGEIIGFILILIQFNECHILNIAVIPGQQRQGYGLRLLSSALTEAKQQGAEIAYLEVRQSNDNAIALYSKMGFQKISERKNYYREGVMGEDAWVFVKYL